MGRFRKYDNNMAIDVIVVEPFGQAMANKITKKEGENIYTYIERERAKRRNKKETKNGRGGRTCSVSSSSSSTSRMEKWLLPLARYCCAAIMVGSCTPEVALTRSDTTQHDDKRPGRQTHTQNRLNESQNGTGAPPRPGDTLRSVAGNDRRRQVDGPTCWGCQSRQTSRRTSPIRPLIIWRGAGPAHTGINISRAALTCLSVVVVVVAAVRRRSFSPRVLKSAAVV